MPFSLTDRKVEFTVPFGMLKTTEGNTFSIGSFSFGSIAFLYFLTAGEYGATTWPNVSGTSRLPSKDGGSCVPSPDGSTLTFAQSHAGGTLITSAGTWNFGTASNGYGNAVLLNGGGTEGWATPLEVANGGQLYAQSGDGSWWRWNDRGWSSSTGPRGEASADGSTLTPESPVGYVLVTSAGRWNFGMATNAYGNAVLLNGGGTEGWATLLVVANGGQLYALAGGGSWWRWNNPGWSFSSRP